MASRTTEGGLSPTVHPERLAALRRTALLDTPAEESFDRLTRLAARLLRAPVALVSLVDEDRQFFKSQCAFRSHGLAAERPRCRTPSASTRWAERSRW